MSISQAPIKTPGKKIDTPKIAVLSIDADGCYLSEAKTAEELISKNANLIAYIKKN